MSNNASYKFKFTLICAVYNVEDYVAETLDSFIAQDIGFEENVQVVLVNDGSRDRSGEICDEYAAKYPNNITVIHKENGGVSTARNEGLRHIEGKYYNFCDPDDLLTSNTLSSVWEFFEENEDKTDMVTIPMHFFEAYTGVPYHNSKFDGGTRLIDLEAEPYAPLFSSSSSFIHSRVKELFSFDTRLSFSEDAKYVQQILLMKKTLGVVSDCKYMYRRRVTNTSAINSSQSDDRWYFDTPRHFFLETIEYAKKTYGYLPRFVQHTMLCDIKWRLIQSPAVNKYLGRDDERYSEYFALLTSILSEMESDVILTNEFYDDPLKLFVLKDVKQLPIKTEVQDGGVIYTLNGEKIFDALKFYTLEYQTFEQTEDGVRIDYAITSPIDTDGYTFGFYANGRPVETREVKSDEVANLHLTVRRKTYFEVTLPLSDAPVTMEVKLCRDGKEFPLPANLFGKFFPLNTVKTAYYYFNRRILYRDREQRLVIKRASFFGRALAELKYCASIIGLKSPRGYKVVAYRGIYFLSRIFRRKKRWLLMDRINKGDDNAEALFTYLCENCRDSVKPVFAVARGKSFDELSAKYGNVVEFNTKRYYVSYIVSDAIISSHVDDFIRRPLSWKEVYVKDLTARKSFIFLQHGISQNDISAYLNKYSKNIRGLVVAANTERKLFAGPEYAYSEDRIWPVGFARFDRLYSEDSPKLITVMPTWRSFLATSMNGETGVWNLTSDFTESAFFGFYNSLLNDERVIGAAEKCGYTLSFMPHPILAPHMDLFEKNDKVLFLDPATSYRDVYARSALILTDYSSAAFDFAYLRKPIVYAQFDREEMLSRATTYALNTEFYDRHALGEICFDYETTVRTLVEYMESGCKTKPEYLAAMSSFFIFDDKENCRRITEKIKTL